jgi:integrase
MRYLRIDIDDYQALVTPDPKIIQQNICDFIVHCKSTRNLAPKTISLYLAGVRHFYDQADIVQLNWKKINKFKPEHYNVAEDRGYTRDEVSKVISLCDMRNKAVILLLFSSGIRVGSVSALRIKDLEPIDRYNIYKLTIYRKSKFKYTCYCSSEAKVAIDQYLHWRTKTNNEKLHDESPLFRREFNATNEQQVQNPIPLSTSTLQWTLHKLNVKAGIRELKHRMEGQRTSPRQEIMQAHGFRKAFEYYAINAGMVPLFVRRLLGQKSGLEDSYLKLSENDLLEGNDKMVGYIGIMDNLTVDESHRLRKEVQELRIRKDQIDDLRYELEELKKRIGTSINCCTYTHR